MGRLSRRQALKAVAVTGAAGAVGAAGAAAGYLPSARKQEGSAPMDATQAKTTNTTNNDTI